MPQALRILFLCALFAFPQLRAAPCQAEATPADTTSHLADRSLAGPRLALGVGAALTIGAPVVGVVSAAMLAFSGPSWLGCEDWFSGQVDEQCVEEQRIHERHVDRAMPRIIGGSVSMGLVGVGLTAFGIARVVQIKRARARRAYFQSAGLELTPRTTQLSLRFRF